MDHQFGALILRVGQFLHAVQRTAGFCAASILLAVSPSWATAPDLAKAHCVGLLRKADLAGGLTQHLSQMIDQHLPGQSQKLGDLIPQTADVLSEFIVAMNATKTYRWVVDERSDLTQYLEFAGVTFVFDLNVVQVLEDGTVASLHGIRAGYIPPENLQELRSQFLDNLLTAKIKAQEGMKIVNLASHWSRPKPSGRWLDLTRSVSPESKEANWQKIVQEGFAYASRDDIAKWRESFSRLSPSDKISTFSEDLRQRKSGLFGGRSYLLGFRFGRSVRPSYGARNGQGIVYNLRVPEELVIRADSWYVGEFSGENEYVIPHEIRAEWIQSVYVNGELVFERGP